MRITQAQGSPCIGDGPVKVTVEDCPEGGVIEWFVDRKPNGAADPTITDIGDGEYEIEASVKGAYILRADCCGT